jgi:hypothetical protein
VSIQFIFQWVRQIRTALLTTLIIFQAFLCLKAIATIFTLLGVIARGLLEPHLE